MRISSPFFLEQFSQLDASARFAALNLLQSSTTLLLEHLTSLLPKGGTVCAVCPKTILNELLPIAAQRKNCTVVRGFMRPLPEADLYLTEPDGFTPGGALVLPTEVDAVASKPMIGVGFTHSFTTRNPETHDFVTLVSIVCERGIFRMTDFENTMRSLRASSLPSASSQAQLQAP